MGTSTDAILFYGYCWSEETTLFEDTEQEWPEIVARKLGHKNPWDEYDDSPNPYLNYKERQQEADAWTADHRAEIDAWHAVKKEIEVEFGVELGFHCSGSCPMPYLSARQTTADRGYPKEIKSLTAGWDWIEKLDRWFAEMGIEKPHPEPKWWLVSYWSD